MQNEEEEGKIESLGKYVVLEEIGRGGMARVFRAEDTETGELVAIKVLIPELTAQVSFVKRFRREIETLRSLEHPGIVKILDVGQEGLYQYYVMEYMDGPTLEKRFRLTGKFSVPDALEVARAIANALQYAHAQGVIHRDIKPANIMTNSAGDIKLADFGIAKDIEATRLTVTGGIVGTADYMSPEQAEGRRVTRRSDIYSLGVCLYEMLTGKVPFTGKTYLDVIRAHRFTIPESPKMLNPLIPGRVAQLVESMMEKDPDKRPASAGEVIAQIDAIEHVSATLTDEERDYAREMVRWALFPASDWKTVTLKVGLVVLLAAALVLVAWGARYRYFTTAGYKFGLGMEAFRNGRYDEADRYFEHVIYFHPHSPESARAAKRIKEIRYITHRKKPAKKIALEKPDALDLYDDAVAILQRGRRDEAIQWLSRLSVDFAGTQGGRKAAEKLAALTAAEDKSAAPPAPSETAPNAATPADASPGNAMQHPAESPHKGPAAEPAPRK